MRNERGGERCSNWRRCVCDKEGSVLCSFHVLRMKGVRVEMADMRLNEDGDGKLLSMSAVLPL